MFLFWHQSLRVLDEKPFGAQSPSPLAIGEQTEEISGRSVIYGGKRLLRWMHLELNNFDAMVQQLPEPGTSFENRCIKPMRDWHFRRFGTDDLR